MAVIPLGHSAGAAEVLTKYQRRLRVPLSLAISLTDRCNFRCKHCYHAEYGTANELSTAEWLRVFHEAADLGVLFITLTGGEVLLRDDIVTIVTELRRLRFSVTIKTNGYLLDNSLVGRLVDAGLQDIHISFYTTEPSRFDAFVHRVGAYERIVAGIRLLRERDLRVNLAVVVMDWNIDQVVGIMQWADEIEATCQIDYQIRCRTNGSNEPIALSAPAEKVARLLHDPRLFDLVAFKRGIGANHERLCGAGSSFAFISPSGDVQPCQRIIEVFGNVRDESLSVILPNLASCFQDRLKNQPAEGQCVSCRLKEYCSKCPGLSLIESKSVNRENSTSCFRARVLAMRCGAIGDEK